MLQYSRHTLGGAVLQQQTGNGGVTVPDGVVERRVVLVAGGVEQRAAQDQSLHHCQVTMVARLMLAKPKKTHTHTQKKRESTL